MAESYHGDVDQPTVSVIVITNRSDDALAAALRSVVGQDYRPLEVVLFGNGLALDPPEGLESDGTRLRMGASPANLGVAGGRNAAARLATGELLLFLDDDAVLVPGAIGKAVEAVRSSPQVGAVAFQLIEPDTRATIVWLYNRDVAAWSRRSFDAPWFLGGAHLIRRDLFQRLDGFWEGYFREMEEIDLSWRLLDAGFVIRYEPLAAIEHPKPPPRSYRWTIPCTLWMLWRLLPAPLALRQTVLKLPLFAFRALRRGQVSDLVKGFAAGIVGLPRALRTRSVLGPQTVTYLRRDHAMRGLGARLQWSLRVRESGEPAGQPPTAAAR